MDKNQYLTRIRELENENRTLRRNFLERESAFGEAVEKIPYALVLINRDGAIQHYNRHFIDALDFDAREIASNIRGLSPTPLRDIAPSELMDKIKEMTYGESHSSELVTVNQRDYMLNVYTLRRGQFSLIAMRAVTDVQLSNEELVERLQEVIERSMKMVQNIGFVMGEETASTTAILNSIIRKSSI